MNTQKQHRQHIASSYFYTPDCPTNTDNAKSKNKIGWLLFFIHCTKYWCLQCFDPNFLV